ncbi:MAG: NAD(P)H-dependent glycerol-3-phosphate dehydrogenase [Bacteroidales bacterium]|nr:NAD(P)H-dependent glycerol-3-phosphate dehydrogenase [Bacteroidales bacterium]
MNIAVLGSGSWATAIVKILCENHDKIFWWVREEEIKESVQTKGHNPLFLRSCELNNKKIELSTDINTIINNANILFCVIPSAFIEKSFENVALDTMKNKIIVTATKGMVPNSNKIVSLFFKEEYNIPYSSQAVISGPSHAEEIATERLTYLTCGSENKELALKVSSVISCKYVNTILSDDIEGIEYAGVLKNVYALAAGIAFGLGYGDNYIAVLISNASIEMKRFLDTVDKRERDINRLVYLGDLLVTAYSQHSRNRTFGQMIGKGYSVKSAQIEMQMIAEGYFSVNGIHNLNKKLGVELPIVDAVYRILYEEACPNREFSLLSEKFI